MPERARTTTEGGAVDLEGYPWPSLGEAPADPEEAAYEPGKEPDAGTDNDHNSSTTTNHELLNAALGAALERIDQLESDLETLQQSHNDLQNAFESHNHDSRYYRQNDIDEMLEDYLLRDGSLPMTGNLDVGDGNRVENFAVASWDGGELITGSIRHDPDFEG
ncbi:hypothetical protein [Halalkalicoccus jeotgali]|uniref:Uncharacterized protein n=1 Tax=Halalkalicoccus jeotgali (strain DSM 18796 / CECT 7217 / JCM 14584 / KCTC 4019 / B3) TaxID=795797 RepID=D8J9P7_HALJB|nr:hypothetical protein [Halalkalicoccus jeotgali]ADJ14459.1 hypothetical protein HacjB3_05340 [Halalkalicoccus jeotgali B3]ELY40173.1 hypothetical protein C497_03715 [Halalkalicoccus jeotgali B3]